MDQVQSKPISEKERIDLMSNIEKKTELKLTNAIKIGKIMDPVKLVLGENKNNTDIQQSSNVLKSIMQEGADEFKEKMGRNMTYSEMREMYG
jgi:hypothetical protein